MGSHSPHLRLRLSGCHGGGVTHLAVCPVESHAGYFADCSAGCPVCHRLRSQKSAAILRCARSIPTVRHPRRRPQGHERQ